MDVPFVQKVGRICQNIAFFKAIDDSGLEIDLNALNKLRREQKGTGFEMAISCCTAPCSGENKFHFLSAFDIFGTQHS